MRKKVWKVKNRIDPEECSKLGKSDFLEKVEDILLAGRGIDTDDKAEFLNSRHPGELPPEYFGLSEEILDNAVSVILSAIGNECPIVIHGDFDCDGVCATAILWETIYRGLGYEKCLPFIPDRFSQGYGMSEESLGAVAGLLEDKGFCDSSELADCQADSLSSCLLITVDCGITAEEEIKMAREMGWEVLVTDHHQPDSNEVATFTSRSEQKRNLKVATSKKERAINRTTPKRKNIAWTDKICGAGIAWLIAKRLAADSSTRRVGGRKPDGFPSAASLDNLLSLVALAAVADVEPLLGPNRSFVKYGLEILNKNPSVGVQALMKVAGVKKGEVGTYELGWILAPRINAAGRLDSAMDALRLLCTEDRTRAGKLARKLDTLNRKRQEKTEKMVALAQDGVETMRKEQKFLVVSHREFHEGVIGLIAGKLTRKFYRPTVAISEGQEFSKGSARSVSGFDIVKTLREMEDLLEGVGGHPMAAGFTIRTERIQEFRQQLSERAERELAERELKPVLAVDLGIPLDAVGWHLWEKVQRFEPFGEANSRPLFFSRAGVVDVSTVGRTNSHLKLKLNPLNIGEDPVQNQRESVWSAIGFGMGKRANSLRLGDKVEIVYSLLENKWNGRRSLELKLKDLRKISN